MDGPTLVLAASTRKTMTRRARRRVRLSRAGSLLKRLAGIADTDALRLELLGYEAVNFGHQLAGAPALLRRSGKEAEPSH